MTNRDVYLLVCRIGDQANESGLSLEAYLRALWGIARVQQDIEPGIERVTTWLEQALTAAAPPFDDSWRAIQPGKIDEWNNFEDWENIILFQLADLHRMQESGQLENPHRYFGIVSPSGHNWYNFDVQAYLFCSIMHGGRREFENNVISSFDWQDFAMQLWCGQTYE